jgi:hypothetical protein
MIQPAWPVIARKLENVIATDEMDVTEMRAFGSEVPEVGIKHEEKLQAEIAREPVPEEIETQNSTPEMLQPT